MNLRLTMLIPVAVLFSCNQQSDSKKETSQALNQLPVSTSPSTTSSSGLIGEWEKDFFAIDKNGDNKIDESEKTSARNTTVGTSYFHFKSDGSCEYESIRLEGKYEILPKGNKKAIYIYPIYNGKVLKEDPIIRTFYKEPGDEMIIWIAGTLVGYKRIK